MTELGVYILGATALTILAAAGITVGDYSVMVAVAIAAGASYLAQLCSAIAIAQEITGGVLFALNTLFMATAFCAWAFGVYSLAT